MAELVAARSLVIRAPPRILHAILAGSLGTLRLARRLHDRLDLLHVVDVEGADAVAAVGGGVEELP